jgi:actin-related protein
MCIIDLGHNATHVVPVMGDTIVWNAVRRSVISQRILTNLLKETLSFRQWDMMDEPWLVGHIKERCCFVASKAGRRGDIIDLEADRPSSWSYAGMIEMCQDLPQRKNPLVVEYILPDYSPSSKEKLGYVRSRKSMKDAADDLDTFIASGTTANGAHSAKEGQKSTSDNEEEDDDSGDDFHEGSPNSPAPKKTKVQKVKAAVSKDEEESEQVLILERERFQIPEVMFDPGIIGACCIHGFAVLSRS